MATIQFSENNITGSLALVVANNILDLGYLVYWHAKQAVQIDIASPDWYFNWNTNFATYMIEPNFSAAWANAKGLLMLTDYLPTEPRFIERPIDVVGPIPDDQVQIPALSIEVGPPVEISNYELGSRLKWYNRHLVLEGYLRNRTELSIFKDQLAEWFRGDTPIDIRNHDAGNLALIGTVSVLDAAVDYEINRESTEQTTFHVICNARLEYVA